MKVKYAPYFFALLCFASMHAQQDSLQLSEVTITDYRSNVTSKMYNEVAVDSASRNAFSGMSASQLLFQLNTCFVKAYGPGNIASLSIRGSSALQTAVVWNGININNPMLGQADISLLPVSFFNSMSVQKGALSGYWGSGAMAGVLNLTSSANDAGLKIVAGTSYSTLQNITNYFTLDFARQKLSGSTKVLIDNSQNRYQYYRNADSLTKEVQAHAQTKQFALLQDLSYAINKKQQAGLHVWFQNTNRQSPYTLVEKDTATQLDVLLRAVADWKFTDKRYSITARAAYINEGILYNSTTYSLSSDNSFSTFVADAEGECYFKHGFSLIAGSVNMISTGFSDNYAGVKQIIREALFENLSWKYKKVLASVYGRHEMFNANTFVNTGGVNALASVFKWATASIAAGTVYRYPSLNELYWVPGGNPNQKPEKGWSGEGSLRFFFTKKAFSFSVKGTLFSRVIDNWLAWSPVTSTIWSPQNILQVWSRGGETVTEMSYRRDKFFTSLFVTTNYVLTSRTKKQLQNDESEGKQMIYVPMYSGSAIGFVQYKNMFLRMACTYTGYRYTTTDNYGYLKPYLIIDARLGYNLPFKSTIWNIYCEANNLFNENYFSIDQRPMPLRNFRIGIQFEYHKPKK